ncbi:MAG: FAD-dependent thymidylate synthase [Candidatus Micrarchaeota archaeon]|nr:FAD-dependent thymidylate synthase [Candidatus Micrarchaeota archaeon]
MEVKLIAYTPHPDLVCAVAARTSRSNLSPAELFEKASSTEAKEKALKLLKEIIKSGHASVTEHVSFTFSVSGVSRALTHELVRHRMASYTQQSQRYVRVSGEDAFVIPATIKASEKASKLFKAALSEIRKNYDELIETGIPVEDARYILPNATKTTITITMNGRELLHFFSLRCCERAQWEIRELAEMMAKECRKVAPVIFEKAGPSCVQLGTCPEGEFSCGKLKEMKEKYAKL